MDRDERRALLRTGREAFNRGEFYEAHEHWEEVWDVLDEPERLWVQGMIQIATGLHKLERHRPDVCTTLLTKALAKLAGAPAAWEGLDLAGGRGGAERILAELGGGRLAQARSVRLAVLSD